MVLVSLEEAAERYKDVRRPEVVSVVPPPSHAMIGRVYWPTEYHCAARCGLHASDHRGLDLSRRSCRTLQGCSLPIGGISGATLIPCDDRKRVHWPTEYHVPQDVASIPRGSGTAARESQIFLEEVREGIVAFTARRVSIRRAV
jgi:hypothetical protein